jgi:alanine dehydrogenase
MGAGAVGMFAIQAAVRYGHDPTWKKMAGSEGVTGVQVTVVEYDTTSHASIMTQILKYTDILIDATQRPDPIRPVIPNEWIGVMRPHAVCSTSRSILTNAPRRAADGERHRGHPAGQPRPVCLRAG